MHYLHAGKRDRATAGESSGADANAKSDKTVGNMYEAVVS